MPPKTSPPLSEAIAEHLDWCERTRRQARSTLLRKSFIFSAFARAVSGEKKVRQIDEDDIQKWFDLRCSEVDITSDNTLKLEKSTIRTFLQWCGNRGYRGRMDLTTGITVPETAHKEFLRIPPARWPELLDRVERPAVKPGEAPKHKPRDRAVIAITLYTGARSYEAANMVVGDITTFPDDGSELAGRPAIWITRGKTKQTRDLIPIFPELEEELDAWLTHYAETLAEKGIELLPEHKLLPLMARGRVQDPVTGLIQGVHGYSPTETPSRMAEIIKPVLIEMGYDASQEGMHTLRRTVARGWYDDLVAQQQADPTFVGDPLRIVMALLGHKDIRVTQRYLGLDLDRSARDRHLLRGRMIQRTGAEPTLVPESPAAAIVELPRATPPRRHLSVVKDVG